MDASQTYLVSDGEDVLTPELIRCIATSLGCQTRLLPVPPGLLRFAGLLTGKSAQVERLLDSLVIDSSKSAGSWGGRRRLRSSARKRWSKGCRKLRSGFKGVVATEAKGAYEALI